MMHKVLLLLVIIVLGVAIAAPGFAARPTNAALWAVVNVDGSLARGNAAISSAQLGVDGQYEVVFSRDVSHCAYVAAGGEATSLGSDDAVVFTTAPRYGNVNAVFVQEWDGVLGYDYYSSGFHLVVTC